MARKNILFITPVMPSLNRRGRNFRAYQWVWRLQRDYQVSVLCTSVYGAQEFEDDESLQQLDCEIYTFGHTYSTFQRIKNLMMLKPSTWNSVGEVIEEEVHFRKIPPPELILCFRIQNAQTALYLKTVWGAPEIWLDIDEVDSSVKFNIANQMMAEGHVGKGVKQWLEATLYSLQERRLVSGFDTVFSSTNEEEKKLKELDIATETEVLRNMLPAFYEQRTVQTESAFTFMFVGDSNYFPNLDAINFLLFDIIPGLERIVETSFRFIIIGGEVGAKQRQEIEKYDCVMFYQDTDDLLSIYDQTDAVIVPLRAGGGSSLKFLEALRFKKPVVATPIGARGFDVSNGVQALIGEDSDSIVKHCLKLMSDKGLARNLAKTGHQWFLDNHSFDIVLERDQEKFSSFDLYRTHWRLLDQLY